jgi:predicted RNase H-like nuclease (RuvC/YqgF family)
MPWYCIPFKYQKHVKQQQERIRHLEKELKEAREEICKLKSGNVSSNFMEQDNSGNWKKQKYPTPGSIGSLQVIHVKLN